MALDPRLEAVRVRLRTDFGYYASKAMFIRTKAAKIKPLILNRAQRRLVQAIEDQMRTTGKVRIVILKGRQMGSSTVIGGWLYWWTSLHEAQKTFVVAHKADSTGTLFDMTKRFHDLCPELLKPTTRYAGRRELDFAGLQSSYAVATAGGDGIGRAETITALHASEVAFWPAGSAKENWNSLIQAIPNSDGTAVFVESTANGVTGAFYDLCQGAIKGENGFLFLFLPWFWDEGYTDAVPEWFERTADEEDLARLYGLDNGQLMFRRRKIAETSKDQFRQEYPCCADEAFLTTGMPVFSPDQLVAQARDHAKDPARTLALEGVEEKDRRGRVKMVQKWLPNSRGQLFEYLPHDPRETYYIGADVAMGVRNGDWSVAQVLDSKKRQAAVYRARVHPDYYGDILFHLGKHYNNARLAVESNNHGILTNNRLAKELHYENLYIRETVDKLTDSVREEPGFDTNAKTKPLIIDQLRATLRESEVTIFDRTTLSEMRTYVVTEEGRMQAEDGTDANGEKLRDDCVMSLALANHIHEGKFEPVPMDEDSYITMI